MHSWERESQPSVWKIAVGVALGIVLAGVATFAVRMWLAQRAIEHMQETAAATAAKLNAQAAAMIERDRAARAETQRLADEKALAARQALAAKQRAEAAAKQAAFEEEARRELAWAKFYRKPKHCDDPPTNEALVECANQHIRAKRAFEAAYAAGKL